MRSKKFRTHYDNLKIARDAPPEVIRAAYRVLAQRHHPDRNPGSERAARAMTIINASYAVLSDPGARAAHDAWIAEQERSEGGKPIFNPAADNEAIRVEPRRHTEETPSTAEPHSSSPSIVGWIASKARQIVVTVLIAMAIGAVFKLPRAISMLERTNQLSSSPQPVRAPEGRFAASPFPSEGAASASRAAANDRPQAAEVATEEQLRSAMCALEEMPAKARNSLRASMRSYLVKRDIAELSQAFEMDEIPFYLSKCFLTHATRTMSARDSKDDFAHFYDQSERAMRLILMIDVASKSRDEQSLSRIGTDGRMEVQRRNERYYR